MDLTNSTVKTPEVETETPTRIQPTVKPPPFTNGVLKRHPPLHHHLHHPVVVTYKECLKNHAATLGAHAVDGCGEFMPSPSTNPTDPTSLTCAACGCHRNFHRREPEDPLHFPPPTATPALEYQPHNRHHPPPPPGRADSGDSPNNSPSPPPISSAYYPSAPHMLLALSHSISAPPSDVLIAPPVFTPTNANSTPVFNSGSGRKRHRTKFTQDQKDKMLELAERVAWKMQKRDEDVINEYCSKIGIDKGVFKVWMHNNKNTFGRKDQISPQLPGNSTAVTSSPPPAATVNGSSISYSTISYLQEGNREIKDKFLGQEMNQLQDNNNRVHQILGTNGSSSSS